MDPFRYLFDDYIWYLRTVNTPQVAQRRSSHLLQDHSQDFIIGSPSCGVTKHSRHALFIEHHAFVSLEDETKTIEEALRDADWIIAM